MSTFITAALLASAATVSAFAPMRSPMVKFSLKAEEQTQAEKDAQNTVKDLNLEEMFEVFEKADNAPGTGPRMGDGKFNIKEQAGVSAPLGYFDPVGLCPTDQQGFKKFRESELKHGRIAMVAVLGVVVGESGANFFGSDIGGPAIYQYQIAEGYFNAFSANVLGFALAIEGYNIVNGWQSPKEVTEGGKQLAVLKDNYTPGDLKFDPLGLMPKDKLEKKARSTQEINNGRLAMLAIAGIVAQELVTNEAIFKF
eukprot:CAMPEP_0119041096 /NCGR_PEP_ID=MMETSP1177-20130426/11247_1 /TAXON_ID=2985 /ORGANISM="Ochromonas sp, Strain CCMP1899" /LENGTH=253 /DNA_ID=CAMNT_0007006827 /DNA_START=33 /DNA_END=794 /DNA_ORIENTATION=+